MYRFDMQKMLKSCALKVSVQQILDKNVELVGILFEKPKKGREANAFSLV